MTPVTWTIKYRIAAYWVNLSQNFILFVDKLSVDVRIALKINIKINSKDYLILFLLFFTKGEFFVSCESIIPIKHFANEMLGGSCFVLKFENKSQCMALKSGYSLNYYLTIVYYCKYFKWVILLLNDYLKQINSG